MKGSRISRAIVSLAVPAVVLATAQPAAARDSVLDATFGRDGRVTTRVQRFSGARDVALQGHRKIVAAGFSSGGGENHFALVRYTARGRRDFTFGADGDVSTDVRGGGGARAIAVQRNGKIVAAGHALVGRHDRFAVVRYNTDGSVDRTFGHEGMVTTPIGSNAEAFGIALEHDGRIVVVGTSHGRHDKFAIARYRSSGRVDATFSGDGVLRTAIGTAASASDVAVRHGKITVAGEATVSGTSQFAVTRYLSHGALDRTFDGNGKAVTKFGTDAGAHTLLVQGNGKMVVAGFCEIRTDRRGYLFGLVRYRRNGSLDPTFGKGGRVTTTFGQTDATAFGLVRQAGGKLVAIGRSGAIGGSWRFALSRYRLDGRRDAAFGTNGRAVTGVANNAIAFGGAVTPSDKILAFGEGFVNGRNRFVGARYLG
jgi:uncharacterized delta-60 repeat protein